MHCNKQILVTFIFMFIAVSLQQELITSDAKLNLILKRARKESHHLQMIYT